MTGLLLLLVFAVFAALMFARVMPALIAVPAMAVLVAAVVGLPLQNILNDVVSAGAVKLAPAYVAVFAGAMLGRVMIQTGIAEEIIKRAAEFGGDRPMVVAGALMVVTAVLFTSLTGDYEFQKYIKDSSERFKRGLPPLDAFREEEEQQ